MHKKKGTDAHFYVHFNFYFLIELFPRLGYLFGDVISTVGITKQKDGLTYMDVDYQANLNLLEEAKKSGVKKFIYVSVLNGEKLKATKICYAKEKFVERLKNSGIEYCVVRPNGFYSDIRGNKANIGFIQMLGIIKTNQNEWGIFFIHNKYA